jgi:hypothetical protein
MVIKSLSAIEPDLEPKMYTILIQALAELREYLSSGHALQALQPSNIFLDTSGDLHPILKGLLQSCRVSFWALCPTPDRTNFYLDVTGQASEDEFNTLKTKWMTHNQHLLGMVTVPNILYKQTQPMRDE